MIRRVCACGATIAAADLDGWIIWLDNHPVEVGGLFRIFAGDDIPRVTVDPGGSYQRHICPADPPPPDVEPAPAKRSPSQIDVLRAKNERASVEAAARSVAAVTAVLSTGRPLPRLERQVAQLRLDHPTLNLRQLAAAGRLPLGSCTAALYRVLQHAEQLTTTGAAR